MFARPGRAATQLAADVNSTTIDKPVVNAAPAVIAPVQTPHSIPQNPTQDKMKENHERASFGGGFHVHYVQFRGLSNF